jgi:hypothetical protein
MPVDVQQPTCPSAAVQLVGVPPPPLEDDDVELLLDEALVDELLLDELLLPPQ